MSNLFNERFEEANEHFEEAVINKFAIILKINFICYFFYHSKTLKNIIFRYKFFFIC